MGIAVSIDIEGMEAPSIWDYPDGKGLVNIVIDCGIDEDNLIHQLAKKYSFDLTPFTMLSEDDSEDSETGPWQNPSDLRRSAICLLHAFKKEGKALIGRDICYNAMEKDDVEFYKDELRSVIKICRIAIENKKRIRLVSC